MSSTEFIIDREALRKNLESEEYDLHREWYLRTYIAAQISSFKEKYCNFLNDVKMHIPFFE